LTNVGPIDGIETNPFGIWDREGTFRLHYGPERRTGSFTLSQWGKDFGGEDIVTKKLSDELKRLKLPSVDLLKVDAETAESPRGAHRRAGRAHPQHLRRVSRHLHPQISHRGTSPKV
jgi:hypothetical protein